MCQAHVFFALTCICDAEPTVWVLLLGLSGILENKQIFFSASERAVLNLAYPNDSSKKTILGTFQFHVRYQMFCHTGSY